MKKLFSITGMDHTSPTLAHRLGIRNVDRSRPLRITMESTNLKAEFMSKLWRLKYAEDEYKKIRITDDFTFEEREEIRQWVEMAKNKNEEENNENEGVKRNYTWKVRGTPKTGLRIVKIRLQWGMKNKDEG